MKEFEREAYIKTVKDTEGILRDIDCVVGNLGLLDTIGSTGDAPGMVLVRVNNEIDVCRVIEILEDNGDYSSMDRETFIYTPTSYKVGAKVD